MNVSAWSTEDIGKWVEQEQLALRVLNEEAYQRTYTLHQVFRELERRLIRTT